MRSGRMRAKSSSVSEELINPRSSIASTSAISRACPRSISLRTEILSFLISAFCDFSCLFAAQTLYPICHSAGRIRMVGHKNAQQITKKDNGIPLFGHGLLWRFFDFLFSLGDDLGGKIDELAQGIGEGDYSCVNFEIGSGRGFVWRADSGEV